MGAKIWRNTYQRNYGEFLLSINISMFEIFTMNILIISVIRKKKTRKNPCFQICLKNKKLLIWKPQRSVNFSISAEHLLVRPFQLFTCYRTFFSFTVSSSFFYKCCLWIPSKSFPVVLQAIFFFWINFFQKVNSKLALPTLQIPPGWTNK